MGFKSFHRKHGLRYFPSTVIKLTMLQLVHTKRLYVLSYPLYTPIAIEPTFFVYAVWHTGIMFSCYFFCLIFFLLLTLKTTFQTDSDAPFLIFLWIYAHLFQSSRTVDFLHLKFTSLGIFTICLADLIKLADIVCSSANVYLMLFIRTTPFCSMWETCQARVCAVGRRWVLGPVPAYSACRFSLGVQQLLLLLLPEVLRSVVLVVDRWE